MILLEKRVFEENFLNIFLNISAKPSVRDLNTVTYIHTTVILSPDLNDSVKVLAGAIFPGYWGLWGGFMGWGWGLGVDLGDA